jgi:hypothetical protein
MKVEGFGFRLRRPHLADNFWVRFVDTDGNQLTNSTTKIPEQDFDFDSFTWQTPAMSATVTAVMQISLNN